ncbi:MAG: S9 family peptidase [Thermoanaerobaculia bacterium]|jgi:dipeptidyl aminopeptidase/acylaminoacyl peptidase
MRTSRLALLTLVVLASFSAVAAETKPIDHETLFLFKSVGTPAPSPDGKWVLTSVSEPAYDEKDEVSDIWIVPADGSAKARRLTAGKGGESGASWSPDGKKIAFTAKRDGDEANQLYVLDLAGGEAQRVTKLTLGARSPKWSPDGKTILFQSAVWRGAADEDANKKASDEKKNAKTKVRAYDSFPIRQWDKWLDDKQTHLFVVAADGSAAPRDLLAGTKLVAATGFRGTGSEGSSDSLDPEWAPDSKSIVINATVNLDIAAHGEPTFHLYEVAVAGGEPKALSSGAVSHTGPSFSPDGKTLCFTTAAGAGVIYAHDRLACAAWPWSGAVRQLAPKFDRSVASFAFTPDGKTIYVSAEDGGHIRIWSVPTAGGEPKLAIDAPQGAFRGISIPEKSSPATLFANWESATSPSEVVKFDLVTKKKTTLTSFNTEKAASIDWQPLRDFWFTAKSGRKIHSFVALPPGFDETKKYPLLVLMHGGHANMWTDVISKRWNYHLLAKPGYVVVATDYRGSTGYGEQFTLDIVGDPLRGPAIDINEAANEAIRLYPFIDGTRQCAAGASYGGHLANWMEASTDRYKCLISHAGLASLYAQWATSDGIYHRELMMGAPFWEKPEVWMDQSPTTYAKKFKTPMLVSVGENDYRVPINNTLEMYAVLQRQQVPSRLLVWPDTNHWITKGEDSRRFYEEVEAWLGKWLK